MAKIRFTRRLGTVNYGTVDIGDVVEVSDQDARRYIANGLASAVATPKKAPAKRSGRAAGRNGKEG
jgi:hypothetical protein